MADNKSCEGKITTLQCMKCEYREVFTERQFKSTDGLSCDVCNGPTFPTVTKPGEEIRNRKMSKRQNVDFAIPGKDLTVKIHVDVSDALKGLKAVQREAKRVTHALREVEKLKESRNFEEVEKTIRYNGVNGPQEPGYAKGTSYHPGGRFIAGEEKTIPHAKYQCLVCEHSEQVHGKKEDYMEIRICPKCKGAFVDTWKMFKYKN